MATCGFNNFDLLGLYKLSQKLLAWHLREICTLCDPERRCSHADDDRPWDEGVKPWVELSGHVEGVAEHGHDHGPLGVDLADDEARQEHGGNHQRYVDD